jgi:integrative and conjugative element protein (TIGR02256 family)
MLERAVLAPGVGAVIAAHIRAKPGRETGGILAGYVADDMLTITRASPPGPRAVHRPRFFSRDSDFLQGWIDRVSAASNGAEDYVGEWHVHLAVDAPPSGVDRHSLYRIARQRNYPTEEPILIIAEVGPATWRPRAWAFRVKPRRQVRELTLGR